MAKPEKKEPTAQESAEKAKTADAKSKRKLTIKEVCGPVKGNKELMKRIIDADGQAIPLMDIFGVAVKTKTGETDKGEFVRFIGKFKAINLETGEVFAAPQCILPNFIADDIYGAMAGQDNVKSAQFAFRIGAYYDPQSVTQYVYTADPLIEPAESDALALLEKQVQEQRKLLAAPK